MLESRETNLLTQSASCAATTVSSNAQPDGIGDRSGRPVRRVQLIFPPMVFSRFQSRQTALFPLGLGYVGSTLLRAGYEVELVDCPSEGYETLVPAGKDRLIYGLTEEQIRKRIEAFKPDVVAISCLFSTLENRMMAVARIAKRVNPDIIVICGGPHVSAFYERITKDPAVDFCVNGEGEYATLDLLDAINGKRPFSSVHAISYLAGGELTVQPRTSWIQDLDVVPHPARELVDLNKYFSIGKTQGLRLDGGRALRIAQMTTSRGCPFQCTYCAKNVTWGKAYRTRSAENVLDEIEMLVDRYGVERLAFQDDNFTADMERAERIFDGMVERKLPVTWEAHNGLGVNFLSPHLLEKMRASGCESFTIAVESANSPLLRQVRKPNYIKLAPAIVTKAKELGIEVRGFFMIGFPGETLDEVWRTVEYARNLRLAVSAFAIVTPLPGTVLYKECVEAGLVDEATIDFEELSFGAFDLNLSKVPVEQLKCIRKIEWLKTVFLDEQGRFKTTLPMSPKDMMDELKNGLALFPDNEDIGTLLAQAKAHFQMTGIDADLRVAV
ncbi:MAG: radical SAM protein [Phycisphaerales bacterium]|nr:radical SAM protein [Phycisphaerales bacterium]